MIEYSLFQGLPAWSQTEVLINKGTIVAQRQHQGWSITLYSLHNFFVERWVKNTIDITGTFHQSANILEILEPYLDNIQIQDFIDS